MAWVEYTRPGQQLRNESTLEKIVMFLEPVSPFDLFRPSVPGL
jgi:hypothetical protein